MPLVQQPLPTKAFYLDRLGNMSTSSSILSSTSSVSSATSCSTPGAIGGGATAAGSLTQIGRHKQILSLKPKQPNTYVQHLDHKPKEPLSSCSSSSSSLTNNAAPVTMLALKKKDKTGKNVVTQLTYRKPSGLFSNNVSTSSSSSGGGAGGEEDVRKTLLRHNSNTQMANHLTSRRPGSPSSSGYETDSLLDQENCDVFSSILNASFGYNSLLHHHDMLHSHPIWSPQPSTSSSSSSTSSSNGLPMMTNHFMENEKSNKFLIQ